LNQIKGKGGLPYHIEYVKDEQLSTSTISMYVPHAAVIPVEHGIDQSGHIPFENVVITDLAESATPSEMRSAALRHLQSGKPFYLYGHAATPEPDYHNTNLFPSLYPTLYPFGVGGFEDSRRFPAISIKAHARHLLNIADGCFREHPSFLFSVFNVLQRREIGLRTMMRVSRSSFESKANVYANLQPETIQRVTDQLEKGVNNFLKPDERRVFDLMRDVHLINSTVMGSGAARMSMRHQIWAMITSYGAPSLFITINPADVYNPLVKLLAGADIDVNTLLPDQIPTFHEQSILIAKDPALAARFFHIYMQSFFNVILQYDVDNHGSIKPNMFGATKGYYGTVEAQGRGSLHCHLLLWLEGGLNPSEIRDHISAQPFGMFKKDLITYLETNIQTGLPLDPGDVPNVPLSNVNPCSVCPICHA
jgi:hypothetical protein